MQCPRCEIDMVEVRARGGAGGAYRESWTMVWGCRRCGEKMLQPAQSGHLGASLARSMLVRDRKKAPMLCPACMTTLDAITLGWDDEHVELEECPGCRAVFVDDDELETTRTLVKQAASLQAACLDGMGGMDDDPLGRFVESVASLFE
ncbi:MAG: zf-TFIIB domain-containing protein [Myxococcales bacterium]|nr:zf-TFIIB domain-containing protein [Myxococcales bacterium]